MNYCKKIIFIICGILLTSCSGTDKNTEIKKGIEPTETNKVTEEKEVLEEIENISDVTKLLTLGFKEKVLEDYEKNFEEFGDDISLISEYRPYDLEAVEDYNTELIEVIKGDNILYSNNLFYNNKWELLKEDEGLWIVTLSVIYKGKFYGRRM